MEDDFKMYINGSIRLYRRKVPRKRIERKNRPSKQRNGKNLIKVTRSILKNTNHRISISDLTT
jgi:hypothetical protein